MSNRKPSRPPTLATLFAEAYRELTSLDSRIWRTVRDLVRPGVMAADWQAGRRDHVLPPIRLYLIGSTLYFLAGGGVLLTGLVVQDISTWVSEAEAAGLSSGFLQDAIFTRTMGWIALARVVTLIPFALMLAPAWPRGVPRVAPAFVLSMHFYTLAFLISSLLALAWLPLSQWQTDWSQEPFGIAALLIERAVMLGWLIFAIRRTTGRGWFVSLGFGLLLTLVDFGLLFVAFGVVSGITEAMALQT